jgi:hypothetical protein
MNDRSPLATLAAHAPDVAAIVCLALLGGVAGWAPSTIVPAILSVVLARHAPSAVRRMRGAARAPEPGPADHDGPPPAAEPPRASGVATIAAVCVALGAGIFAALAAPAGARALAAVAASAHATR